MITIESFDQSRKKEWDDYVNASPGGTFYHLSGWVDVLGNAYHIDSQYLMALDSKDTIVGILPMFLMRDIFLRSYLVSNPFSNFCGVRADSSQIESALIERAKSIVVEKGIRYLEIRNLEHATPFLERTETDFVTMTLDLREGKSNIWKKGINSKVRNSVRKGEKSGLEFDSGNHYLNDFYTVFSTNMRDLGTPTHSLRFFEEIVNAFGEIVKIFVVKSDGKTVGAMFSFSYKNVFSEPWASTLRGYNHMCPADFLYWGAIQHACHTANQTFDFGRSTLNTGTYKFKKKWGAKPTPLIYQYFKNTAQQIQVIDANAGKYQLMVSLWKRLPLPVSRLVGSRIIRHLHEL